MASYKWFGRLSAFVQKFKGAAMLRTGIVVALLLGLMISPEAAVVALAENKTPSPCRPLVKLRADFEANTHFTALTPGQFHFVEGIYVGSPTTPDGLPPGDGAMLATHDGAKNGIVLWIRGPLACGPIVISEKLIKLIANIKTGPVDAEGNEL